MLSVNVKVAHEFGLHLRPATRIAQIANTAKSRVWLVSGNQKADATSIISVLMLSCMKDSVVSVNIDSQEDLAALENISELLGDDFDIPDGRQ